MILDELRSRLAQLSVVKNIPAVMRPRTVMALLAIGQEGKARKGFVLFREGDPHDDVAYILVEGSVAVEKTEVPAIEVGAPHLLGEMVQFNPSRQRSATVTAATDVRLLRFTWNAFSGAAQELFTPEEVDHLQQALADVAWSHFTE